MKIDRDHFKTFAAGLVMGLVIAGGICAYNTINRMIPQSVLATPSKELAKIEKETLKDKPVVVYKAKAKKELGLPESVKSDPDKHVTASTSIPGDEYPRTITSVYDSGLGSTEMYVRQDPLPFIGFNRRNALGVSYGARDGVSGGVLRADGRIEVIQVKAVRGAIIGSIDTSGGWFAGFGAEVRW